MPARALSLTMTPDEIVAHNRERNRKKQAAYKARQKAAKLAQAKQQQTRADSETSEETVESSGTMAVSVSTESTAPSLSSPAGSDSIERLAKRVAELEEGAELLKRLKADSWTPGLEGQVELAGGPETEPDEGLIGFASTPPATDSTESPASTIPRRPSITSSATYKSCETSSISLFASLLNDSSPSSFLLPNLRSTSFIPHKLNVDILRRSLGLPCNPTPVGKLPSYSYNSPVDLCSPYSPPTDSSWKVALFELHRALSANRAHPTEGYLNNDSVRATLNEAQLLIFQLMMATSDKQVSFDARRVLSKDHADYLAQARIDARLTMCPDPLFRILIHQASITGKTDLTEMAGFTIELSSIFGDVWDAGGNSMPDSFYTSLPRSALMKTGHRSEEGKGLRGASIREIVLGLEEPGWRRKEVCFPVVIPPEEPEIEVVYLAQTLGPRRRERVGRVDEIV